MDNRPLLTLGTVLVFVMTLAALSGCATVPSTEREGDRKEQRSMQFDTRAGMVSVPMGWR